MNISLQGKKILVTGATGTIGSAIAISLVEADAQIWGSYAQDQTQAKRLSVAGISMHQADLTDRAQVRQLMEKVLSEAGDLDGLVYCAGNTKDRILVKMTDEEWDQVLKLHLDGLAWAVRWLLPPMQSRRQGKIVALGSQAGLTGRLGQSNYAAAKAGAIGFMKSVAREAGRFGVTANVVLPGFIDSKMTRSSPPEAWERSRASSALGTISSVEVVASFMTWLLSDLCFGVTGQVFQLDSRIL